MPLVWLGARLFVCKRRVCSGGDEKESVRTWEGVRSRVLDLPARPGESATVKLKRESHGALVDQA